MTDAYKQAAANKALEFIKHANIIGVGTGSTVNFFIAALASLKNKFEGAVASSVATEQRLKQHGIPIIDLNHAGELAVYVDGADEVNHHLQMIKGGGGALTREKIIAAAAREFIGIADENKLVDKLGNFPVAIEVIPMARSYVARQLVKLGGFPVYRERFLTDNGNVILDVHNFSLINPVQLEETLNGIAGVVCNGLFAKRRADKLIIGTATGVRILP